jgi:ATP:ADP antiporter, AAA family
MGDNGESSGPADEDPWGFLAAPKASRSPEAPKASAAVESEVVPSAPRRERGEIRAQVAGPSLKRRALPTAVALGAMSFTAFLTQITAASQLVTAAGAGWLLGFYALGGIGLLLMGALQFGFIDQQARLPMIRAVMIGYGVLFAIAVALSLASPWLLVGVGLLWVLAEQTNYLVPLLVWTLAGDEFNVAEGRKIFPWIATFGYAGQVLGLGVAAFSPWLMEGIEAPLLLVLILNPITCIVIGIWLARSLKGTSAAQGLAREESFRQSIASAREFVQGVPVWRHLLLGSMFTFIAGMTLFVMYLGGVREIVGDDPATIQRVFGLVGLVACLAGWAFSVLGVGRLLEKWGIPGTLLILPIVTVIGGVLVLAGIVSNGLLLVAVGMGIWLAQRWSVDRVARRAALALVPNERRARLYFLLELAPVGVGLIVGAGAAAIGVWIGLAWPILLLIVLVAVAAVHQGILVRQGWEESLLNWRLRRRKTNRSIAIDFDLE